MRRVTIQGVLGVCVVLLVAAGCAPAIPTATTVATPAKPAPTVLSISGTGRPERTAPVNPTALPWLLSSEPLNASNARRMGLLGSLVEPSATVNEYGFTKNTSQLLVRDGRGMVFGWSLITGKRLFTIKSPTAPRTAFWTVDGTQVVTVERNAAIRLWDGKTGAELSFLTGDSVSLNDAFAIGDGKALVLRNEKGGLSVWRPATARSPAYQVAPPPEPINAVALSADEAWLVTATAKALYVYDGRTGAPRQTIPLSSAPVSALRFSADGSWLALLSGQYVYLLSVPDFKTVHQLYDTFQLAGAGATFSPDSSLIAVGGRDFVFVWSLKEGAQIGRLPGHGEGFRGLAWSPDGKLLVTVNYSATGGVFLWSVDSFRQGSEKYQQAKLTPGIDQIYNVAWAPDSRYLLLGDARGPIFAWGIVR